MKKKKEMVLWQKKSLYLNLRVNLKRIIIFLAEAYNNEKYCS